MSAYTDQANFGHYGQGVTMEPVVSDVFGHFGMGVTLATNFLLSVTDEKGAPVDTGISYTLSYYDPATGQSVMLTLYHNPAVPYQATLPEGQPIAFTLVGTSRYKPGQTATFTIATNTYGVLTVKLAYPAGSTYAVLTRKRIF